MQSQGRPEGLEMAWDSHLHYPSCKEQHTIVSTGVIGRKMRNTPNNYKLVKILMKVMTLDLLLGSGWFGSNKIRRACFLH